MTSSQNLITHKFSRSVSQQSLHSKSSTSSMVVKSGKGRLKNYSQESFASRCQRNKVNKSIGLSSATSKTMSEFESKLAATTTVTISTKIKRSAEFPLIGKTGYRVSLNVETIGFLISPSEKGCCGGTPGMKWD
ncbi:hypothetical protein Fcan01_14181 [Folsomia candida]|uniref:Uncharacterized protein n=1 Tax=Folsomia candida TaxID=158441 RepID=A0A226E1D0_FOLCA|nr:hypothetical protein Fcan01_14181 [Folsomia candida]